MVRTSVSVRVVSRRKDGGYAASRCRLSVEFTSPELTEGTRLTDVTVTESLTSFGSYAFQNCASLTDIRIPQNVCSIGQDAFSGCDGLTSAVYDGSPSQWSAGVSVDAGNEPLLAVLTYAQEDEEPDPDDPYGPTPTPGPDDPDPDDPDPTPEPGSVSGSCGDNVFWTLADGVLTISGTGSMGDWSYWGGEVVSVVIEEGVTGIGSYSFNSHEKLESVSLPSTLTKIGREAFHYCSSLREISIPEGVTDISAYTFEGCNALERVSLPMSLTSIGERAFADCNALAAAAYPGTAEDFYAVSVASGNRKLWDALGFPVKIGGVCTDWNGEPNGVAWALEDGVLTITGAGDLFPNDVFWDFSDLYHTVIIPETITSLEPSVLSYGSLRDIYYGGSALDWVKLVGMEDDSRAVLHCGKPCEGRCGESLTWTLTTEGVLTVTGYGTMWGLWEEPRVGWADCRRAIVQVVIREGAESVGSAAFYDCVNLTGVNLSRSVTSIGYNAFRDCKALTELTLPDAVSYISEYVFQGCDALETIHLPESLTYIGGHAFQGCQKLDGVELGSRVSSVGEYAFAGCTALTSIRLPSSLTSIQRYTFLGCTALANVEIEVPVAAELPERYDWYDDDGMGNRTYYYYDENGEYHEYSVFVGGPGLQSIEVGGLAGCSAIETLVLPEGFQSLKSGALDGCVSLREVTIPATLTDLGYYTFSGCSALTDLYYNGTLTQWLAAKIVDNRGIEDATIHIGAGSIKGARINTDGTSDAVLASLIQELEQSSQTSAKITEDTAGAIQAAVDAGQSLTTLVLITKMDEREITTDEAEQIWQVADTDDILVFLDLSVKLQANGVQIATINETNQPLTFSVELSDEEAALVGNRPIYVIRSQLELCGII